MVNQPVDGAPCKKMWIDKFKIIKDTIFNKKCCQIIKQYFKRERYRIGEVVDATINIAISFNSTCSSLRLRWVQLCKVCNCTPTFTPVLILRNIFQGSYCVALSDAANVLAFLSAAVNPYLYSFVGTKFFTRWR